MNWNWFLNLFWWHPYKLVSVTVLLADESSRKRRTVTYRVMKHRHQRPLENTIE